MRILCVCTGNTCRSPMLQTLLRAALRNAGQRNVTVESAGTGAAEGEAASDGARRAMTRRGLSLNGHRSRPLAVIDPSTFDRVLCMTSGHAAVVAGRGVPGERIAVVNAAKGGVPDPFGGDDRRYEATAQVLEFAVRDVIASLPDATSGAP